MASLLKLLPFFSVLPALVTSQWTEPPPGPADPSTVKTCTFWIIAEESSKADCHGFAADLGVSWQDFSSWNPSVGNDCAGMIVGNAYCIEDNNGVPTTTTTTTTRATTTSSGPVAPGPTQDGQDPNCISWEYVAAGENCRTVLAKRPGVTLADLYKWNPAIGSDCSGLWAQTWVCVAVKGWVPPSTTTTTTTKATTTTAGNGINTPTPTQAGMVGNCNKFYFVKANDGCSAIASQAGIPIAKLYEWNPALNGDCTGLWADVYVCIGTTTYTATLTTTTKSTTTTTRTTTTSNNGVATPSPIQDGMTKNCNKFYFVKSGDGCSPIASQFGVTLANFYAWNPAVKNDCSGLWANVYVCVGLIGSTPTPTTTTKTTTKATTTSGIVTPTPTQSGMVKNCKKFHFVQTGQTCETIQRQYSVTLAQLFQWNSAIGSTCTGMWAQTYLCVGV
ncbi:hypothetical protein TWF192_000029 [Orbilia oligospora]|uniref:Uncharacterized protein n=1 Tax=Orbilia oligospora TaxID=2813651 RepID=A0A6G1MNK5_ORBOL|nr:hypothetical protein TWF191_011063 [Orbilia oligospora]KAF3265379.1 hypothetical protein TWF192_000029 [Orbilia oligospora]